jgi:TusA-related sulfurtransferase
MIGKIYRVTYNVLKQEAELHLEDGEVLNVPMTDDEWKEMIKGDVVSNFQELLDTFEKECEKEMNKGPYLLDPVTGEKTYYE